MNNIEEKDLNALTSKYIGLIEKLADSVQTVDVFENTEMTFAEAREKEKTFTSFYTPLMIELAGMKPFQDYEKLISTTINEIIKREGKDRFLIKEGEFTNNWLRRIRSKWRSTIWVNLYSAICTEITELHDKRIHEYRDLVARRDQLKKEHDYSENRQFLQNFISKNEEYINLFLRETKKEESQVDSYGLKDITIFDKKVDVFIEKLLKNYGHKEYYQIEGYYRDFINDLKIYLKEEYKSI